MNVFTKQLYENIFEACAFKYKKLNVISGYGSASFLRKVINDYPNLEINLYLGMTYLGISYNDHKEYQNITYTHNNVNIYYQIKGVCNHMKVLKFSYGEDFKTFAGSANFSENGFLKQKELMVEVHNGLADEFINQHNVSLLCTNHLIEDYVTIFDKEKKDVFLSNESSQKYYVDNTHYQIKHFNNLSNIWINLHRRADTEYYKRFYLTAILQSNFDNQWSKSGINSVFDNKTPFIKQTPRLSFTDVFPEDEIFYIYGEDGTIFESKLTGNFYRQLEVINLDLYNYFREKIGLQEKRPIHCNDLDKMNCNKMFFTRINRTEYLMSFSNYMKEYF